MAIFCLLTFNLSRHVLSGHTQTVSSLVCQEADPQVITGSLDSHVRLCMSIRLFVSFHITDPRF